MKVLIACEESQVVCKAFREQGHEAYSCDILDCSGGHPEWHIKDNVLKHLEDGWDLMIAHPPCTYLCVTGNKWFKEEYRHRFPNRVQQRENAIDFFMAFVYANIRYKCIENPVGVMSTRWRSPDQIIQPYYFGDEASKTTCLWLENLPPLRYGKEVQMAFGETKPPQSEVVSAGEFYEYKSGKRTAKWYADAAKSGDRAKVRSQTFQGIANAMAEQWG